MVDQSTIRRRHRKTIAATKPPCHWCGKPIDYTLPYLHQDSFEIDHVIPLALGGPDTLANKVAAHLRCNRAKGPQLQPNIIRRSKTLNI